MFQFTGRLSALSNRNYFRYWTGSFASVGATQLQTMAQAWLLYELTGSALSLGYLGAAASIPAIIMTVFGGALADRLNKQHVLMVTSMAVALLMVLLAWLDATDRILPSHIILTAGMVSFISGFDWPTRQAIFPALIERKDMMSAVALNSIVWQSSRMVIPAFGGLLIGLLGTWVVFAFCALGFFVMFAVIANLRIDLPVVKPIGSTIDQVTEGFLFILQNKLFLFYFTLTYSGMFFGMAHMQLMPVFATLLGTSEQGYGLLLSATGVGAVFGTILVGSSQHSKQLGKIILATTTLSALMVCLFAYFTATSNSGTYHFTFALVFLSLASMFSSMFLISSMTVLQLNVPDRLRGRVMGLHSITYSLMPLGGLLAGWIASFTSAPTAIVMGISVYLLIIASITISQKEIRDVSSNMPM